MEGQLTPAEKLSKCFQADVMSEFRTEGRIMIYQAKQKKSTGIPDGGEPPPRQEKGGKR